MARLLCTYSHDKQRFIVGKYYHSETVRRCGHDFHEVKAENGFPLTLQPGDCPDELCVRFGYDLQADFIISEDQENA